MGSSLILWVSSHYTALLTKMEKRKTSKTLTTSSWVILWTVAATLSRPFAYSWLSSVSILSKSISSEEITRTARSTSTSALEMNALRRLKKTLKAKTQSSRASTNSSIGSPLLPSSRIRSFACMEALAHPSTPSKIFRRSIVRLKSCMKSKMMSLKSCLISSGLIPLSLTVSWESMRITCVIHQKQEISSSLALTAWRVSLLKTTSIWSSEPMSAWWMGSSVSQEALSLQFFQQLTTVGSTKTQEPFSFSRQTTRLFQKWSILQTPMKIIGSKMRNSSRNVLQLHPAGETSAITDSMIASQYYLSKVSYYCIALRISIIIITWTSHCLLYCWCCTFGI